MYGQTEATARISWMPPEWLEAKPGGVGRAIPGGQLSLEPVPDAPDLNEMVYTGPNVMMGYAADRAELALGDEMNGILRTGDLGRCDEDGCYFVTGRLKRFAKLFGSRVSLDDVENQTESAWPVRAAATDRDGVLVVFVVPRETVDAAAIRSGIAASLTVPLSAIEVRIIDDLPLTTSGKKDYRALPA